MANQGHPKWIRDLAQLLPIRAQFVLSGNIRDRVLISDQGGETGRLISFKSALWSALEPLGYDGFLIWDMVDGLQAFPNDQNQDRHRRLNAISGLDLAHPQPMRLASVAGLIRSVNAPQTQEQGGIALIVDFSSRIREEGRLPDDVREFFTAAEKAAIEAMPVPRSQESGLPPMFNPIIWLANRLNDLPYWLTVDNERVRSIPIGVPDADTRKKVAALLWPLMQNKDTDAAGFAKTLANLTHDMSLNALYDIVTLAGRQGIPASDIDKAVQSFRVGDLTMQSPWRGEHLRNSILSAETPPKNPDDEDKRIASQVKGQPKAVNRVLDILKRTSIGLTGAHARSSASRPRGVLFFVGPTGVGKTEMAKAIAKMVFGDDTAFKRFDMSEFSAEHSGDRLIGAPPGYVGFDQGGELTNAVRERPFRVLLFDEIEKAHPRILDKFLQVLEDGRLTDGRGETVFFSESLIIFTSNIGISRETADGKVEIMVKPGDPADPDEFERILMKGVDDHFKLEMRRPELLNRLGENVVVFHFIAETTAAEIMKVMFKNIQNRIKDEHDVDLKLSKGAEERLRQLCASGDLSNGGRGIGSKLESVFINPLARFMFNKPKGGELLINEIRESDGIYELIPG